MLGIGYKIDPAPSMRDLICFWTVRELGMSLTDLARYPGISVSYVGYGA